MQPTQQISSCAWRFPIVQSPHALRAVCHQLHPDAFAGAAATSILLHRRTGRWEVCDMHAHNDDPENSGTYSTAITITITINIQLHDAYNAPSVL